MLHAVSWINKFKTAKPSWLPSSAIILRCSKHWQWVILYRHCTVTEALLKDKMYKTVSRWLENVPLSRSVWRVCKCMQKQQLLTLGTLPGLYCIFLYLRHRTWWSFYSTGVNLVTTHASLAVKQFLKHWKSVILLFILTIEQLTR